MKCSPLVQAAGAVLTLLLSGPASAADLSQLIASAGLTPSQASGMSLEEIAIYKFDREGGAQESHTPVVSTRSSGAAGYGQLAAAAGVEPARAYGMSLDELYVRALSQTGTRDERQVPSPGAAAPPDPAARQQLAVVAGISPGVAASAALDALALEKFNDSVRRNERMPSAN
jgi:hypothetical protein